VKPSARYIAVQWDGSIPLSGEIDIGVVEQLRAFSEPSSSHPG
jgi:hypothetical protein